MDAELTQELLTRGGFTRLDTDISGVSQPAEEIGGGYEQGGIGNSEPAPSANSSNSGDTHPAADERSYLITMLIEELTQLACLALLSTGVNSGRVANERAHGAAEERMINICSQLRRDNLSWDQIILMTCYGEHRATFKDYLEIAMYEVDPTEWQRRRENIALNGNDTLLTHTPPPPPSMPPSASTTAGNIPVTPPPLPPPPQEGGATSAAVNTLLTPQTAADLKARTNIAGTSKKEMRALLNQISESQPRAPTQLVHEIPAGVPWRHYIARHADCEQIVGSGIVRAYLSFCRRSVIRIAMGNSVLTMCSRISKAFDVSFILEVRARMPNRFSLRFDGD